MKKLSESIEKEKEILNDDKKNPSEETSSPNAHFFNYSPYTFQKVSKPVAPAPVLPSPQQLKLNNRKLNNTSFLKAHTAPSPKESVGGKFFSSPQSPQPNQASFAAAFSKASVDNRPKQLLITGIENSQEKIAIVNFIKAIGCQVEAIADHHNLNDSASNLQSFVINFVTRKDAEIV